MGTIADIAAAARTGAATLYKRIRVATHGGGPADDSTHQLQQIADQLRCVEDALARAVRKVNIDSVSGHHDVS
jgi:UrcA family protein